MPDYTVPIGAVLIIVLLIAALVIGSAFWWHVKDVARQRWEDIPWEEPRWFVFKPFGAWMSPQFDGVRCTIVADRGEYALIRLEDGTEGVAYWHELEDAA